MGDELRKALIDCETDVEGAIKRFYGNEDTYMSLLNAFTEDKTIDELEKNIKISNWDDAFMAAHALKGLAGNMGFTPLFHSLGELILILRDKSYKDVNKAFIRVMNSYYHIVSAIKYKQP